MTDRPNHRAEAERLLDDADEAAARPETTIRETRKP